MQKHLRADGQEGWGNRYRTLLASGGQSAEGWTAFRAVVLDTHGLTTKIQRWVRHWDAQMTAQTARRATIPPHYSTGVPDPHIAVVRKHLERRAWTFRNLSRVNALLGLLRLHINRHDVPAGWARLLVGHLAGGSSVTSLGEPARTLIDGSRECSLWKHPVPQRPS